LGVQKEEEIGKKGKIYRRESVDYLRKEKNL